MHEYPMERSILKYIRIIDKLIRVPPFMAHLQHCLVEIYSDCFGFIAQQKSNSDLEELKLLRKYWVGRVHPMLLYQIKQKVMERTGLDVDAGIRSDSLKSLKSYYVKLGLTPQEIEYHLEGRPETQPRQPSPLNTRQQPSPLNRREPSPLNTRQESMRQ